MASSYSIRQYGLMVGDPSRMQAYDGAMRQAIRTGDTVIDLGTGTGMLAMRAVQLGAGKVYAIDVDDSIQLARKLAIANGMQERIEFIQGDSRSIQLPEKADVLIADLRSILPTHSHHFAVLADARDRWLKPEGHLLPESDHLFVAAIDDHCLHMDCLHPWADNDFNLDLSLLESIHGNTWIKARAHAESLLGAPVCWATLNYRSIRESRVSGGARSIIQRSGTFHGASVWFDANIDAQHGFSNAPTSRATGYSMAFFPCPEPVPVLPGNHIDHKFDARLVGDQYVWSWSTTITDGDKKIASFDQSDAFASLAAWSP